MNKKFKTLILIIVVSMLSGALGGIAGVTLYRYLNSKTISTIENPIVTQQVTYENKSTSIYSNVVEKVYDAVVEISTEVETTTNYFFSNQTQTSVSKGSGVIISKDGYIVTNYHVIENGKKVEVTLSNGNTYTAKYIGSDQRTDLALIKIEEDNLTFASIVSNDEDVKVGQEAIAIGNALGRGVVTTNGIVSAVEKEVSVNGIYMNLLQTNAAINSGNSGGGLFNLNGDLIGIVNAKIMSNLSSNSVEGMGYAIPSSTVNKIIKDLMENGYVKNRASLGIKVLTGQVYDDDLTSYYQSQIAKSVSGVIVQEVLEDGAAKKAGIEQGDIITQIDDNKIETYADLVKALDKYNVNDSVEVKLTRNGKEIVVKVTLTTASIN